MIKIETLPSTNEYIKEHYKELNNFDAVITDNQTNGRGRSGHTWESQPGRNATFSILVKDDKIIKKFNIVSVISGLTIANYLSMLGINNIKIKWPNDIYVGDEKICGLLLEGNVPNYLVIGVGINVNQTNFEGFSATSIKNQIGIKIDKNLVAVDVTSMIIDRLKYLPDDLEEDIDEYDDYDYLLNKTISFTYNGEKLEGIAKGINLDGSYKILYQNKIINVDSNEINLIRVE